LSSDKDFLRIYEAREKEIKDRISEIETAEEKAVKETKIQLIQNLIKVGVAIEKVAEAAELTIEEVNEILQNK
ncbi:ATPase, partial [Bacillus cereus]